MSIDAGNTLVPADPSRTERGSLNRGGATQRDNSPGKNRNDLKTINLNVSNMKTNEPSHASMQNVLI